ncbi:prepilin peptidase [Streptococcus mutans]|jgi:type IV prepilin peptidase homologue|uniref:prepilin peptidase n=1 Tax=Streptococcus mutans TaxID=1309 RepID=UPI0002B56280|nr:A24 family peptidase [Streptococcus mutans]AMF85863.1 peptidase [Streptococcus mutans]EMB69588.1 signal peptidase type IV [Streptococcus mutans 2ST1]EMC10735.1 signal peptidase type IV [Streptococcus mutans N3209]EMC38176.1 signal peptidase type IV [Streptococcus mutans 21]MCB5024670.1 prepilin peptidase [Streptococcus mutans]
MKLILFFMLGAAFGSFFGLVVDRYPQKSIIFPRSHCNKCYNCLTMRDLIPIFSRIINKNSCRFCGYPIPLRYSLVELLCGLISTGFALDLLTTSQVCLLFMGVLLSLYDLQDQSYPLTLWIGFTFLLMFIYPLNLISLILFLFGIFAALKNINIGSGDFFYLATLALSLNLQQIIWIIQIASLLGILYSLLFQKHKEPFAFVPFLFLGHLIIIFSHLI